MTTSSYVSFSFFSFAYLLYVMPTARPLGLDEPSAYYSTSYDISIGYMNYSGVISVYV